MSKPLTDRQIKFAQNIFSGMTQAEAYIKAGYAKSTAVTTSNNASRLAKKEVIKQYLAELRAKAETKKVMSVQERRERLSEIAAARLTDFQELGQDGSWINIGKETAGAAAISEIVSTTKYDENGASPTLITRIRLHNPVVAIQELNKMDGVYDDAVKINIDNRKQQIILTAKDLTDDELASIAAGGRSRITEPETSKNTPDRLHTVHTAIVSESGTPTATSAETGRCGSGQSQESNCDNAAPPSKV